MRPREKLQCREIMGHKRYSDEVKQKAIELCRSGISTYEAARIIGASQSVVYKWAAAASAASSRILSEKKIKSIKRWYKRGKSTVQIGTRLGVSPSTIYRVLKRTGVSIREHKTYTQADIIKACRLHEEGMSINMIRHHIIRNGKHPEWQTVKRWLDEYLGSRVKVQRKRQYK